MHSDKMRRILQELSNIMTFQVDTSKVFPYVNHHDFYEHLYTEFEDELEVELSQRLEDCNKAIFVVGLPGGGKSSFVYNGLNGRRDLSTETGKLIIDIKKCFPKLKLMLFQAYKGNETLFNKSIHEEVLRTFLITMASNEFLKPKESTKKLIYYAIETFYPDRFDDNFSDWQAKFATEANRDNQDAFKQFYFCSKHSQYKTDKCYFFTSGTFGELIKAIIYTQGLKRFYVYFDNLDSLQIEFINLICTLAIDTVAEVDGNCCIITAVRTPNYERLDRRGFHGFFTVELSLDLNDEIDFTTRMIEKRHTFSTMKVFEHNDHSEERRQYTLMKNRVVKLTGEEISSLSNGNNRVKVVLHMNFIRYMLELQLDRVIDYTLSKRLFLSYFYRWAYVFNYPTFEILRHVVNMIDEHTKRKQNNQKDTTDYAMQCWLPFLLLAFLSHSPNTETSVIVQTFGKLGYSESVILESLFQLQGTVYKNRYIEIGDGEDPLQELVIQENQFFTVKLAPFGKCFINYLVTKFVFLHQCVMYPHIRNMKDKRIPRVINAELAEEVEAVLSFLEQLKNVTSEAYVAMRKCSVGSFNGDKGKWDIWFRNQFTLEEGAGGQTLLERLIRSHLAYLKLVSDEGYDEWHHRYNAIINEFTLAIK
jgi:hypothetical protein